MKYVCIVLTGEMSEGASVEKVFTTLTSALLFAESKAQEIANDHNTTEIERNEKLYMWKIPTARIFVCVEVHAVLNSIVD